MFNIVENLDKTLKKRIAISLFLFFYCISFLLNIFYYMPFDETQAYDPKDSSNIVAIVVDSDVYEHNENEISWYAQEYVQQRIWNSKALVLPINVDNFHAKDVMNMLENLYFEWEKDTPSELLWTVLIWDVPLPVVNKEWFVYPSIYPYTNFENKKFIYDDVSWFFEYTWTSNYESDIWHGMINFDENDSYSEFFNKLSEYASNPDDFVDRKMWYEDFIHMKEVFNEQSLVNYINNFIFLEDIIYNRYTPALFSIFEQQQKWDLEDKIDDSWEGLDWAREDAMSMLDWATWDFDEFASVSQSYFDQIEWFQDNFMWEDAKDAVSDSSDSSSMPTLTIQNSLENFFRKFPQLFWPTYFSDMSDNVNAAGRWDYAEDQTQIMTDDVDNTIEKISIRDDMAESNLLSFNTLIEDAINQKIDDQNYYMNIPIIERYDYAHWEDQRSASRNYAPDWAWWSCSRSSWSISSTYWYTYENFYFGLPASEISTAEEINVYMWDYKNQDINDIVEDPEILKNTSLNSIWASRWLFSTQVESTRKDNFELAEPDANTFENYVDNPYTDADWMQDWSNWYFGWYSPINVDDDGQQNSIDYQQAWNPWWNRELWWGVFDIAWSVKVDQEKDYANSYEWYETYSSLIRVNENQIDSSNLNNPENVWISHQIDQDVYQYSQKEKIDYMDFFDVYNQIEEIEWERRFLSVNDQAEKYYDGWYECLSTSSCGYANATQRCDNREYSIYEYRYNTIDTRVKNTYPQKDQIENMNMWTQDRPITTQRSISFKWLGWDKVQLDYPNIFEVEVFKEDWNWNKTLKSRNEIQSSIEEYLLQKVESYNQKLEDQLQNNSDFYSQNSDAYDFLEGADELATPNRDYDLIEDDFLLNLIWEDVMESVVDYLYYINLPLKDRNYSENVIDDIKKISEQFDINHKVWDVFSSYLDAGKDINSAQDPSYPLYNPYGYEVWFMNTDWVDTFDLEEEPSAIDNIRDAQQKNEQNRQDSWLETSGGLPWSPSLPESPVCWSVVDIWEWPDAIQCWWEEEVSSSDAWWVSLDYSCSMWPVIGWAQWGGTSEQDFDDEIDVDSIDWLWPEESQDMEEDYDEDDLSSEELMSRYFRENIHDYSGDWNDYMNSWRNYYVKDDEINQEVQSDYRQSQNELFQNIESNVEISVQPENTIMLDDSIAPDDERDTHISISSDENFNSVTAEVAAIWDGCINSALYIDWVNVCEENYQSQDFNPYNIDKEIEFNYPWTTAWDILLQVQLCNEDVCYNENLILNIIHASPSSLEMLTPFDDVDSTTQRIQQEWDIKVIKWWKLPFKLNLYDNYWNSIWSVFQEYFVSPDLWNIEYRWTESESISFNNFDDANFLYNSHDIGDAPDIWEESLTTNISVQPDELYEEYDLPQIQRQIELVDADLQVYDEDNNEVNNEEYQLPEDFQMYENDQYWIKQLREDSLMKYSISLTQSNTWEPLNSPVTINSEESKFIPGRKTKELVSATIDWQTTTVEKTDFEENNEFVIEDWELEFYVLPTFDAWEDQLHIDVPWLEDMVVDVEFLPAEANNLDIVLDTNTIMSEETISWRVYVQDIWWNQTYNQNVDINMESFWNVSFDWDDSNKLLESNEWVADFQIHTHMPGWNSYIYWTIDWLWLDEHWPDYEIITVENSLIKNFVDEWRDLNVMYMNLFGDDWANKWGYFSENDWLAYDLMENSSKNLATTSMLTNPDKIRKSKYLISDDINIKNIVWNDLNMSFIDWDLTISDDEQFSLELWDSFVFDMYFVDSISNGIEDWQIQVELAESDDVMELMTDWDSIVANNQEIINFEDFQKEEWVELLLSESKENQRNIWEIKYEWNKVGQMQIKLDAWYDNLVEYLSLDWPVWEEQWFFEWSTNWQSAINIYEVWTSLEDDVSKPKTSIHDSNDADSQVWFRENFKNITLFGWGAFVWESTQLYSSSYLMNIWDPLLWKTDENDNINWLDYDWGLWKKIYSDENESIMEVKDIDFNNNWLKDLLVVYEDGSIRILKNYWWDNPFKDLWNLMVVSDWIKDIYTADVVWNWFEDIIVLTQENYLRVYQNNNWRFSLNGRPVCLDVYWWPKNLDWVHQIFLKDMNNNWITDIVTNDKDANVKIFYWWSSNPWAAPDNLEHNFISQDVYGCGDDAVDRNEVNLVKDYSLTLSDEYIRDDSLIHWEGLEAPDDLVDDWWFDGVDMDDPYDWHMWASDSDVADAASSRSEWFSISVWNTTIPKWWSPSWPWSWWSGWGWWSGWVDWWDWSENTMDMDAMMQNIWEWSFNSQKYETLDKDFVPVYEEDYDEDTIDYSKMSYFTWEDKVSWYKQFTNLDWDENLSIWDFVQVDVHLEFDESTNSAYLEDLWWWWEIIRNDDGSILWFDQWNLPSDSIIKWDWVDQYQFMIDNIQANAWDTISFSYRVRYTWAELMDIEVWYLADPKTSIWDEEFKDISLFPQDACIWGYSKFAAEDTYEENNTRYVNYNEEFVDLRAREEEYFDEAEEDFQWVKDGVMSSLENIQDDFDSLIPSEWFTTSNMFGASWDIPDDVWDLLTDGWSVNLDVMWDSLWVSSAELWEFMDNMCKWFSPDDMDGLVPVPFNMAFLSPWTFNAFGCPIWWDPWLPVFHFPWTMWAWPAAVPVPWWLTWPWDWFLRPWGWAHPSQIRIYVSPTLTQWIGTAICFWSYQAWVNVPEPFGSVSWNCIVTATAMDGWSWDDQWLPGVWDDTEADEEEWIPDWMRDLGKLWTCEESWASTAQRTSPFDVSLWWGDWQPAQQRPFNIDDWPINISAERIWTNEELLRWWEDLWLTIEWPDSSGITDCIINQWMDNQIRYILSNLTNMTIYLKFPDLEWLWWWIDEAVDRVEDVAWIWDALSSVWKVEEKAYEQLWEAFSNPFDQFGRYLDQINLININRRDINIQVPYISQEDLQRQVQHLETWWERNEDTIEDWERLVEEWEWLEVWVDVKDLQNSVEENLRVLQEYKQFPFELYEWIHVVDRFLYEIICIIEEISNATIWWLNTNADRFEALVDAIILMISVIESWQAIIDFSVNWQSECWKCRQDGYDAYSCVLWMMCIDLPILPIPPFNIPDIYIDFSHFDVGIDITLPNFRFDPLQIPTINVPDIPGPPAVDAKINIPEIPVLPSPPQLPEIPSFIPTLKFDLPPILPPAPRIPPMLPQIEAVLDMGEFIWMLYCIIKDGLWMVAEWNVKTRIEQLTQRTWPVEPFDSFRTTIPQPPLEQQDLHIDAYTRLQYNFDDFYNFLDGVAEMVNEQARKPQEELDDFWARVSEWYDQMQDMLDNVEGWAEIDVDLNSYNHLEDSWSDSDGWWDSVELMSISEDEWVDNEDLNPIRQDFEMYWSWYADMEIEDIENLYQDWGLDYNDALSQLKSSLGYLKRNDTYPWNQERKEKVESIIEDLEKDKSVEANQDEVSDVFEAAKVIVNETREENLDVAELIKTDYDKFLEKITSNELANVWSKWDVNLSASLFDAEDFVVDKLENQPHPEKSYIDANKRFVDWINDRLEWSNPQDFDMWPSEHWSVKSYFSRMDRKIQEVEPVFSENSKVETFQSWERNENQPLIAQNSQWNNQPDQDGTSDWSTNPVRFDLAQHIDWFYIPSEWSDWERRYINAINWRQYWTEVYEDENYEKLDLNDDWYEDIIHWDSNWVYVKYASEDDSSQEDYFDDLYVKDTINSPEDLSSEYKNIWDNWDEFKIWDEYISVNNFDVVDQDIDSISLSWQSSQDAHIGAYVIKLQNRVDTFYDNFFSDNTEYVLVMDENLDKNTSLFSIEDKLWERFLADHLSNWWIKDLKTADLNVDTVSVELDDIESEWKYMQVAKVERWFQPWDDNETLEKVWPWSSQVVAGKQIWADDAPPELDVKLYKHWEEEPIQSWQDLELMIWTYYDLELHRKDEWRVEENSIITDDWADTSYWSYRKIENIMFEKEWENTFTFAATDHAWNQAVEEVNLEVNPLDMQIEDVQINNSFAEVYASIEEKLHENEWKVVFERQRHANERETLTWSVDWENVDSFDLEWNYATWWSFELDRNISFYDMNESLIAQMDPDTWELEIVNDEYNKYIDFANWYPEVVITDWQKDKFNIKYSSRSLQEMNILDWNYQIQEKDWYDVVTKNGQWILYINDMADIYIPQEYAWMYNWAYSFDDWNVVFTIKNLIDDDVLDVHFNINPFRE